MLAHLLPRLSARGNTCCDAATGFCVDTSFHFSGEETQEWHRWDTVILCLREKLPLFHGSCTVFCPRQHGTGAPLSPQTRWHSMAPILTLRPRWRAWSGLRFPRDRGCLASLRENVCSSPWHFLIFKIFFFERESVNACE